MILKSCPNTSMRIPALQIVIGMCISLGILLGATLMAHGQAMQLPQQTQPVQLLFKQRVQHSVYYYTSKAAVLPFTLHQVEPGFLLTGLSIEFEPGVRLTDGYLLLGGDTLPMHEEAHQYGEKDGHRNRTALYLSPKPVSDFLLYTGALHGGITFHFIYAPPPITTELSNKREQDDMQLAPYSGKACSKPVTIPQMGPGGWREGLPAPKEAPLFSEKVKHLYIHHEAGANYADTLPASFYTNSVRTIYLYHTQSNGWNDIGYNYLIAQNGAIYSGRDAQGSQLNTEDNVVGAHVGGRNTNTMGVCLLGNFQEVFPAARQQNALENLLAWKALKENLDPFASAMHPAGSTSALLTGTIAGHRDGGATSCPGNKQYNLLPEYRFRVANAMAACNNGTERQHQSISQPTVPVADTFRVGLRYKLSAQATSGLEVINRVAPGSTASASISENTLVVNGAGWVLVEASQPGNEVWNYAEPSRRLYTIYKAPQRIANFGGEVRLAYTPGLVIELKAEGGLSGEPVQYDLLTGDAHAALSGSRLHIHAPGKVEVRAVQAGNMNYEAAAPLVQTFVVDAEAVQRPLVLYPNPARHIVYLEAEDPGQLTNLQLYNMQGKRIGMHYIPLGYHRFGLNIDHLNQGAYIVRFCYEGRPYVKKLIVQ